MTQRTFRRAGGPGRRTRRIRRASAGITPVRAGAALGLLLSAGAIYGLAATSAFGYARLDIEGTAITPESAIREKLELPKGENLFEITTEPLEARLLEIPAVAGAEVAIGLPDRVVVRIEERAPILVWRIGERRLLVDDTGFFFAELKLDEASPPAVADLPVIIDARPRSRRLAVGLSVDAIDLDAATRLASLTPEVVGSAAEDLSVGVTDENGFVLSSVPKSWVAVYGFYGRSLRTPDLIPGQTQLLQKLLLGREETIALIILADDRDGTFIPKPSVSPAPSAAP
jgi:cell division septal protein FtsQ